MKQNSSLSKVSTTTKHILPYLLGCFFSVTPLSLFLVLVCLRLLSMFCLIVLRSTVWFISWALIFVHSSLSIGRCDVYSLQSLHTFIFYKYATIYMFLPSIKPFYVMYLIDIITPNHIIGIIYVILYSVIIDYVI